MCDTTPVSAALPSAAPDPADRLPTGPSRRDVLRTGLGVVAAGLLPSAATWTSSRPAWADTAADGSVVVPMAMHVHASFSEGAGPATASWQTQLDEAQRAGVKVVWATDHDWRMSAFQAPDVFHTVALREQVKHRTYTWVPQSSGRTANWSATADGRATPSDPAQGKGSLRLAVTSADASPASARLYLDGRACDHAHRTNVAGQVLRLQVLALQVSPDSWGELVVQLSHHPATGRRPAGSYQLVYQFGRSGRPSTAGLVATVPVAVQPGSWTEVVLDLQADIAQAWPDLVAADNSVFDLWLAATSRGGAPAELLYAYLRLSRDATGDRPLQVQQSVLDAYRGAYPGLVVRYGLELSVGDTHVNGFGSGRSLPDYRSGAAAQEVSAGADEYTTWSTGLIHRWGGLASINHPFGSGHGLDSQPAQDAKRRQVAHRMLATRAYGADVLEAGYHLRGGATLQSHLALWDTLSRAGIWVTGNGVNDAHGGNQTDWRQLGNRFVTTVLARDTSETALLAALAAGRTWCSELGGYAGLLDLRAGSCRTGQVSVQPGVLRRPLEITATDLPSAATVQVVQGPVDYGTAQDPATTVVTQLPARSFASGSATVLLDTSRSSFVRAEVVVGDRVVAFTNPVWLLQEQPPVAPPPGRRSTDST